MRVLGGWFGQGWVLLFLQPGIFGGLSLTFMGFHY